jgi:translation initiation factor IF-3
VRLIGEAGNQVGIISIQEALRMAEEQNLDLVEVAPNASPPVCRLLDYGKFRYEQSKKEREARKHQKQIEMKEVRLRPKTDAHDLDVKARQARRFLMAGNKVKFTLRFRGRELAHTNIGREILEQLAESLNDIATVEQKPTLESRAFSLVLAPTARVSKAARQARQSQASSKKEEKKADHSADEEPGKADDFDDEHDDFDDDDFDDDDFNDDDFDDDELDDDDFDDDDFDDDDFDDDELDDDEEAEEKDDGSSEATGEDDEIDQILHRKRRKK